MDGRTSPDAHFCTPLSIFLTLLKSNYNNRSSIRHAKRANKMTTYYSSTLSLHLKGDWLAKAGFATDTPVTIAVERDNW